MALRLTGILLQGGIPSTFSHFISAIHQAFAVAELEGGQGGWSPPGSGTLLCYPALDHFSCSSTPLPPPLTLGDAFEKAMAFVSSGSRIGCARFGGHNLLLNNLTKLDQLKYIIVVAGN
ncbi:hypothetical protein Scep_022092 [Stephania cephalantha]|uniref:Uncharacterized protein n=1 Tax=Stephania cephalantha TaxID=152367 RepID=A0AAP0FDI6_9MAGN